jgi:D-lyxose ketol-isomerase
MTRKLTGGFSRRSLLTGGIAAGAGVAGSLAGSAMAQRTGRGRAAAPIKTYQSADFYGPDGKLLKDKAIEAYHDMFRRFGYPVSETLKKEMWVLDFGLGEFARVGMAGIFWLNRQDFNYFGHEIYLLPGQMIAEHSHHPTPKGAAKMESWQPRHGTIYTFGEGDPTPNLLEKIPASQRDLVKSKCGKRLGIDEVGHLNRLTAWHFMVAGPEGALVTEYGTFHDMDGLRFSNPKAKL